MRNSIQHKNNVIDCKLFSEATLLFLYREFMWIVYLECLNTIRHLIYRLDIISGSTTLAEQNTEIIFCYPCVMFFFVIKKPWLDFLIWFDPDIELESWIFLLARNHWSHHIKPGVCCNYSRLTWSFKNTSECFEIYNLAQLVARWGNDRGGALLPWYCFNWVRWSDLMFNY